MPNSNVFRVSNRKELNEFISEFSKSNSSIIAIDGEDGIGKTNVVSPLLAKKLHASIVSVDKFLKKKRHGYADFIDYPALKKAIDDKLKSGPIILEGVIMLKVSKKLDINPDKLLYVCDESWFLDWQKYQTSGQKIEEIIKKQELRALSITKLISPNKKSKCKLSKFRKEMFNYTFEYSPMRKVDSILILTGDIKAKETI